MLAPGVRDVSTTLNGAQAAYERGGVGNRNHACLEVSLLDSTHRRGGYDIPQGAGPAGQGNVVDVTLSSRYNSLAFTCAGGGLYLHYVGPKEARRSGRGPGRAGPGARSGAVDRAP